VIWTQGLEPTVEGVMLITADAVVANYPGPVQSV
jgi:hypothetical protein